MFTRLCKRSHLEKHTVLFITAPNKGINTDAVNGAGYASVGRHSLGGYCEKEAYFTVNCLAYTDC